MSINFSPEDSRKLVSILSKMPEWQVSAQTRRDFLADAFGGTEYKDKLQSLINLDGSPRATAVRTIDRLKLFGQGDPGVESVGVLINMMTEYLGASDETVFLKGLFQSYPLEGVPVSTRGMADSEFKGSFSDRDVDDVKEKVIGENTLRPIYFLKQAIDSARSVLRINAHSHGLGTGFVVGENLIMTNNHVIEQHGIGERAEFRFFYELNERNNPIESFPFKAKKGGLFYTNSNKDLDFTVIELEDMPDDVEPLLLNSSRVRLKKKDRVMIIQHPGGNFKQISLQNNFVEYADQETIQYLTTTKPGSSGSPVLNDEFEVVGLHHSGGNLKEPGSGQKFLRNAGSTMKAVIADIQANAPDIFSKLNIA